MRRSAFTTLCFVLAASGLAGCSSGDSKDEPPKTVQPKAGQCIAEEVPDGEDFAPDTETVVPCSKAHIHEIIAVVDIPKKFLKGKTKKEKLANRTELATIGEKASDLRKEMSGATYPKCEDPFRKASGLDKLTVNGKSAKDVSLRIAPGGASNWYTVTSPKLWLEGTTQVICSMRFGATSAAKGFAKPAPATSKSSKPVIASYLTGDFPVVSRSCVDADGEKRVPCTELHGQELLWVMDMKAVYDKKFLSGADLKDVSDGQFAKIKSACGEPYKQSGGKLGETREFGFRFYTESKTTDPSLSIICTVKAVADDQALGTEFVSY